jgi:hypothetical protein
MQYTEWLDENWVKGNIFPPALEPQLALRFLKEYLLGDWYSMNPISTKQINCEIVHEILYKYSRKYRKEYKNSLRRR